MSRRPISEALVKQFFRVNDITCRSVPRQRGQRTPDFVIELAQPVVCEVKQIEPNDADRAERSTGRFIPNRIRPLLKRSAQLQRASKVGSPTVLILYDATPFQAYSDDLDVVQAMFGVRPSKPYCGKNAGLTPTQNTSVSAVGVLRGGPDAATFSLTLFYTPLRACP